MTRGDDLRHLRLAIVSDTYTPQVNGVARTLERLASAVLARGGAVHVETVDDPTALRDPRVYRAPSTPFWAYSALRIAAPSRREMVERLAAFRPTLVHVATPFGVGLAGRSAARALGVPVVSSYHTAFDEYLQHYGLGALDGAALPFLRWFHNGTRCTFAPSRTTAARLEAQGFDGLRIWGRGVDPLRFHPRFRDAAMRAAMGAREADVVVAYVGRLAPEKQVDVVLRAVARLKASALGSRVRLAIAGDGPDAARLRALAPEDTWFAGMLHGENLARFYASADLLAFPSTTETFGNVVLEAMASGLPVVAPDSGATLELADAQTALTVPAGEVSAWTQAIARLVKDPSERERLRASSTAVAAARTWDSVWDRLFADYAAVSTAATRSAA